MENIIEKLYTIAEKLESKGGREWDHFSAVFSDIFWMLEKENINEWADVAESTAWALFNEYQQEV